jgi:hypothetical protein
MGYTTVNMRPEYSVKLGKLSASDKRSKASEIEFLIDAEIARRKSN